LPFFLEKKRNQNKGTAFAQQNVSVKEIFFATFLEKVYLPFLFRQETKRKKLIPLANRTRDSRTAAPRTAYRDARGIGILSRHPRAMTRGSIPDISWIPACAGMTKAILPFFYRKETKRKKSFLPLF